MTNDFQSTSVVISTRTLGWWMILLATTVNLARICGITAVNNEVPFLSANDRSRWSAIAALTQEGRWEIDSIVEILDSKGKSKLWNTIDMVRHRGADGQEHSYSSKPPLLTLMLAAVTKPVMMAVHAVRGKQLTEDPFLIGRIVLVLVNLIPLVLWWCLLHRWLEQHVPRAWTRFITLSLALWGTYLTTFVVTLNNHLHGAIFFSISLAFAWQIIQAAQSGTKAPWNAWLSLGTATALAVACELPALAWAAAIGGIVFLADWRRMLLGFGFSSALIAASFLMTNYWAHGDWRPPYSHRSVGEKIGSVSLNLENLKRAVANKDDLKKIKELPEQSMWIASITEQVADKQITPDSRIIPARLDGVWQVIDESSGYRVALAPSSAENSLANSPANLSANNTDETNQGDSATASQSTPTQWNVHRWDDWYDYPKSYWLPGSKKGVDLGEPNRWMYLLHFTIGHHGIFSLTPIWIWAFLGGALWCIQGPDALKGRRTSTQDLSSEYLSESLPENRLQGLRRWILSEQGIAAALLAVSVACMIFYTTRETVDRNYGGVSSGFRWLFWLIPGWIWLAIPAIDRCASKPFWRGLVYLALTISIFSITISWPNPWSHPWPYRILMWLYPEAFQ